MQIGRTAEKVAHMAGAWVKVRVLRKRVPLFLEWNLTFRCNLRCKYCGACDARGAELGAEEVQRGLDALRELGAGWVTFGGGEPLLRKDISEILRHAKQKGFYVYLSTNGILLPEKAEALQWVDHVNLSLDGGREVHDEVRGDGSFDKTIDAIALCRQQGVDTSLLCVLSSYNLDHTEEVLALASQYGLYAMFQPATQWLDSSTEPNPIAPPVEKYRQTIEHLIRRKRQGAPIRNSVTGLRHLAHWPDPTHIWCSAGLLTCTVEPDGAMLACHQAQAARFLRGEAVPGEMKTQFATLLRPTSCAQCWCAPLVELALLFSLRPEPVYNALRILL